MNGGNASIKTEAETVTHENESGEFSGNLKVENACTVTSEKCEFYNSEVVCKREECFVKTEEISIKDENTCRLCGKTFSKFSEVVEHSCGHKKIKEEEEVNVSEEFEFCNTKVLCKKESISDEEPDIKTEISIEEENICKLCSQTFTKFSQLVEHNCNTKKPNNEQANVKKQHTCHICGKTFELFFYLKRHIVGHTSEHQCKECGKTFSRASNLKRHTFHHTGVKMHICKVCGKGFSDAWMLRTHSDTHLPRRCEVCGQLLPDTQALREHLKTHSEKKEYKCETCGKVLANRDSMRRHVMMHTGETRYECQTCGKKFRHWSHYNTHLRIHTGERPYSCSICNKTFYDGSCYRSHLKGKMHQMKVSETAS